MQKHIYTQVTIHHENYKSSFNGNTGFYIRSGLFNNPNVDPFSSDFPELIDIGIMETCVCSNKCKVDCYQKACDRTGPNMSLDNYKWIMEQCKGKVYQVALGGAGDPDTHENFKEILEYTAENNIVPNFTTSGIALTNEKAELCYKYCGAVAVSEHYEEYTDKAVEILLNNKVKTNIHYVLSNETIDRAIEILKTGKYRKGINAVVFLLYKPVGLGKQEKMLQVTDKRLKEFFHLVNHNDCDFKVGFDSCSCAALVNFGNRIDFTMMDYCEGGRYSMYISADMKAYACSFANQSNMGFSLVGTSIQEAWDSFETFRNKLKNSCPSCKNREFCMGGCPLLGSITLCNSKDRDSYKGLLDE